MLAKEKSPENLQADILKAVKANQHERRKGELPEERVKILDARADEIADQHTVPLLCILVETSSTYRKKTCELTGSACFFLRLCYTCTMRKFCGLPQRNREV